MIRGEHCAVDSWETGRPASPALPRDRWALLTRDAGAGVGDFGSVDINGWRGVCVRRLPAPRPWSQLNDATLAEADWRAAWPAILHGLDGAWPRYKADASGIVAHGPVALAGREVVVYAKRPRRKRASQWAWDVFRTARARRAWDKTWTLFARGLPTEVPLLVMERNAGPVVLDNVAVFERVAGPMLHDLPLDDTADAARRDFLVRLGRVLRLTDELGFAHFDAKTLNWIVFDAGGDRLEPVMLDCDGVRRQRAPRAGLSRLLRSLARHPQFRPADAAAVCDGYEPAGWSAQVAALYDEAVGGR